jgi:hypothetical protein
MTKEQKIIRAKVALLELAKQLGNVNGAFMAAYPGRWRAPEEAWTTSRS